MDGKGKSTVIVAVAGLIACTYIVQLADPDPWWHLATGRWIVEHHAIPRADPFSFTVAGAPWRGVDWLAELAMYGSYMLAGNSGVAALTALAAFFMLLFFGLTLREIGVPTATTAAMVACVGLMVQGRYSMGRPMTLGALSLYATLYVYARTWQRSAPPSTRGDRSALVAIPIFVVWSALHGTAILGPVLVTVFALAALMTRHPSARVFLVTALSILAFTFLAPFGRGLFDVATALGGATLAVELTTEWARPRLRDHELWLPTLATAGSLLAVLTSRDRPRLVPFVGCVLIGAFLASRYTRNLYEAILLAAPLWAVAVARAENWLAHRRRRSAAPFAALVVGIAAPALHLGLAPAEFNSRFGVGPADGAMPTETLTVLQRLAAGRVMNDCSVGGWLIWHRIPVYCDGRTVTLYREDDIKRLIVPLYADATVIDGIASRFDIHYALARFDSDFHDTLMRTPNWVPIAYDHRHALFVRLRYLSELPPEIMPLDELRYANDARWLDSWYAGVAADPARTERLEAQVVCAATRFPTSRTLHAALHYLASKQPAVAERLKKALTMALK